MVTIKIEIKEIENKKFKDIGIGCKVIDVSFMEKGLFATKKEKEVANRYMEKLKNQKKVNFVNNCEENREEIDELIKELEDKYFKGI